MTFLFFQSEIDPHSSMNVAQDLIPASQILVEAYSVYVRLVDIIQIILLVHESNKNFTDK